jgi:predicted transcriptional regulator
LATAIRFGFALAILTLVIPSSAAAPASGAFGFDSMTYEGLGLIEARDVAIRIGPAGGAEPTLMLGHAATVTLPGERVIRGATLTLRAGEGSSLLVRTGTGAVVESTSGTLTTSGKDLAVHAEPTRMAANGELRLVLLAGSLRIEGDRSFVIHRNAADEPPVIELEAASVDASFPEDWKARVVSSAVALDLDGSLRLYRASGAWAGESVGGTFERVGSLRLRARASESSGDAPSVSQEEASGVPDVLGVALPSSDSQRSAAATTATYEPRISATLSDAEPAAVAVASEPPLAVVKVGLLAVLGIALLAALKKAKAFALLAALGSKIRGDDARRHPARERVLELLRAHPGMRLAEFERELAMTRNTVEYHLLLLKRCGLVDVQSRYGSTRYFLRGQTALGETQLAQVVLRRARLSGEILRAVEERPGVTVSEVSERLALNPSHTMYHLRKLLAAQLVDARKEGRTRRLYPFGQLANGAHRLGLPGSGLPGT